MLNLITQLYKKTRKRVLKRFGVRFADHISDDERDTCERYGENVIGTMLAGGFNPSTTDLQSLYQLEETRQHARDWLTERAGLNNWRDRWVSGRDLFLDLVIIALIGWEIHMGYQQEQQQSENFGTEKQILTNLQKSSEATAGTLTTLEKTVETMNSNILSLQGPVERNAAAAEASSATASKTLHVSERAYITTALNEAAPPKLGDKWEVRVVLTNVGRTNAVDVMSTSATGLAEAKTTAEAARKQTLAIQFHEQPSKGIIGAGLQITQVVQSNFSFTDAQVAGINDGSIVGYVFVDVEYKDVFGHQHRTQSCGRYRPASKEIVFCETLNSAE